MSALPQEVQLSLAEFDREQLPLSQRDLQGDEFREAVRELLATQFARESGAAEVMVTGDRIIMRWTDTSESKSLTLIGVEYLTAGDTEKGIATLQLALQRNPHDHDAMFNLGMAFTAKDELEEAVSLLERLLSEVPEHASAWVALGVAQSRMNQTDTVIASLSKAVELAPADGYARKNLGAMLAKVGNLSEAMPHLQQAVKILVNDPQAWLNYGMALEDSKEWISADEAYQKVLQIDSASEAAKVAEEGLTRIAAAHFRKQSAGIRADAMAYCLGALQRFQEMPKSEVQKIAFEIAMLGSRGLDVNDPAEQYQLQSIPGKFSGLHLVCIQYVGFQMINPSLDLGFDLKAEYQAALSMLGQ